MARGTRIGGLGFFGTYAKAAKTIGTSNAGVTYTAKADAPDYTAGNVVQVGHVVAGASTPLTVGVAGNVVTVNVATNGSSVATSTAAQVVAAVNASTPASALLTAAPTGDGTGTVVAGAASVLTGGTNRTLGRAFSSRR